MPEHYEYRTAGRSAFNIGCTAVAVALVLLLASASPAPWLWALSIFLALALAHQLLACPSAGCRLADNKIETYRDRRHKLIELAEIRDVTLLCSDSQRCTAIVNLRDGSKIRIAASCLPPAPTLEFAMRQHGLDVVIERQRRRYSARSLTQSAINPLVRRASGIGKRRPPDHPAQ